MGIGNFLGNLALSGLNSTLVGRGIGLIGKGARWIGNKIKNNSGIIGQHLKTYGQNFMDEPTKYLYSTAADYALKHMPSGNVKDTLSKINDVAQGRVPSGIPTQNATTKKYPEESLNPNRMTYGYKPTRAMQKQNWNNPTHEPKVPREELLQNA